MFVRTAKALAAGVLIALCLSPALNPAVAQAAKAATPDTQIMDWVFAMPEGWRVANINDNGRYTGTLALQHTDRATEAFTQLTFGRPADIEGDFSAWFKTHWENLLKAYTFPEKPAEPTASETAAKYNVIAGVGVAKLDNGTMRVVMLVGLNKGKRAGVMCFLTEDFDHFEANTARLDGMLATLGFASQRGKNEPALKPKTRIDPAVSPSFLLDKAPDWPKGDFPLEGIWGFPTVIVDRLTQFGHLKRNSYFYVLLFKDGTAARDMPYEGLLSYDPGHWKVQYPENFGTYTVAGDTVTVATGGGREPVQFTLKDGNLHKGTDVYKPIKDEKPELQGRYISSDYGIFSPETHKGVTFAKDGTFDDEGFNSLLDIRWWAGSYFWVLESSPEPGKGKWRVERNTLELIYNDGRKRRFGFHLHRDENPKNAPYLVLNSKFMTRLDATGPAKQPDPAPQPATASGAQDTQVMDWVFAMPEGWRVANSRLTNATTSLLALEHTERASQWLTQVTFGRPEDIQGEFKAWFNRHWRDVKKGYTFAQVEEQPEGETANKYRMVAAVGVADMGNGRKRLVMLMGLNKGKRAGVLCFITEDMDLLDANSKRMEAMVQSVTFASQRAKGEAAPKLRTRVDPLTTPSFNWDKPPAWPQGDFPLEGLWGRPSFEVDTYTQFGLSTRSSYAYVLLFKDGRALLMMPPEGLLSFDLEFWKQEHASRLGRYEVKGETVTVWDSRGEVKYTFTLKDGDLHLPKVVFRRIKDQKPTLNGRYISIDHERKSWHFRKGITFWPNGAFEDEGFNSTLALRWWCGDWYWQIDSIAYPGRGKWRIENQTLELIYLDGRKRRFGFNLHTKDDGTRDMDGEHEKYLVLNSKYMTRVGDVPGPAPDVSPPPPPVAGAPDTQLGDWVFAMPGDWTITANSVGRPVLVCYATTAGCHTWADVLPTAETKDFKAWFDNQWQAVAKQFGVAEADPAQGGPNAAKYDLLARAGLGKFDGKNALVMVMALHRDGKAGALAVISTDADRFAADIEAMDKLFASASLASCRKKDEKAPRLIVQVDGLCTPSFLWEAPLAFVRRNDSLSGVWAMPGQRATGLQGNPFELVMKYYTFFPDGRVIRQMPPEGLLNVRMEHWERYYTHDCGTWQINGDSVDIRLGPPGSEPEVVWFTLKGDTLDDGRVVYRRISDTPPQLSGRWLRVGWEGREKRFQLGITFNSDGTFKDEGFGATMRFTWWCGADFLLRDMEAGAKPGQGKWRVEKHTLELIYEDGRKRRIGCNTWDSDGKTYLVLNGEYLVQGK